MGVPQGSVISPLLFNFYSREISSANNLYTPDIDERYADDLHAAASHVKPAIIADHLSTAANNKTHSNSSNNNNDSNNKTTTHL